MKNFYNKFLAKFGFSLSLLCGLHCLATPVLLAVVPAVGELFSEETEIVITAVSFVIGFSVLWKDIRLHKFLLPLALMSFSFLLIVASQVFLHLHVLDILGILGIATAYLWNWHKLRQVRVCACVVKSE
ncbi:MAG: MerC domain-containing protein [Raineya sp.]|nr:MerC domain-containing protein [Raineya sp.]